MQALPPHPQKTGDLPHVSPVQGNLAPDASVPFIRVRGLHKTLGTQHVLKGIDLDIHQGEVLSLIGTSGGGKSVLLKHLIGLIPPDSGSIQIDGQEITHLKEHRLGPVRRKIGFMFQNGALFDSMNVENNVAFPLIQHGLKNKKEIIQRVHEALDVVELASHKTKMPVDLSGGMRKRVAIARSIVTRPKACFYDEPTAGLDPIMSDVIDRLIRRLQHRFGMTSIVITHDMKSVYHISDRVAWLKEGRVAFYGTPDELKNHPDPELQDFIHGRSNLSEN